MFICLLDPSNLSLPFQWVPPLFWNTLCCHQQSLKGTEARLSKIRWPTKIPNNKQTNKSLILKNAWFCNYCSVTIRFCIPMLTFPGIFLPPKLNVEFQFLNFLSHFQFHIFSAVKTRGKNIKLPRFPSCAVSISTFVFLIKYVYIIFSFNRQIIFNNKYQTKQLQIVNLIKNDK